MGHNFNPRQNVHFIPEENTLFALQKPSDAEPLRVLQGHPFFISTRTVS